MSDDGDKAKLRTFIAQKRAEIEQEERNWGGAVITSSDPEIAARVPPERNPLATMFAEQRKMLDDMAAWLDQE